MLGFGAWSLGLAEEALRLGDSASAAAEGASARPGEMRCATAEPAGLTAVRDASELRGAFSARAKGSSWAADGSPAAVETGFGALWPAPAAP
jgi:hypothetical protein